MLNYTSLPVGNRTTTDMGNNSGPDDIVAAVSTEGGVVDTGQKRVCWMPKNV